MSPTCAAHTASTAGIPPLPPALDSTAFDLDTCVELIVTAAGAGPATRASATRSEAP